MQFRAWVLLLFPLLFVYLLGPGVLAVVIPLSHSFVLGFIFYFIFKALPARDGPGA